MCGICGIIGENIENKAEINEKMTNALIHRGPDQDGLFSDEKLALGMRRLSIIDLSSGKQPITTADDSKLIFFNGEIYNYKELRAEIESEFEWKTNSDTEVLLHLYEKFGEKMLTKLRGMFAFSIYDKTKNTLFIARDYFGIKPLYYWKKDGQIAAFSSEMKSLLEIPNFKREVNDTAVYNYLSYQYNPLDETFLKDVFKLQPAHFLIIDLNTKKFEIKRYWKFEFQADKKLNEDETKKNIVKTIEDSVTHHMIADVPVGSFLSGGVDSSIIATSMQKILNEKSKNMKVKTFTVGFNTLTEGIESKQTSDFLKTDHTEITIGPDEYFANLEKAVWHFDEPVADPSAIGLYFVAREAAKNVKVVLSGEGADELFGGYNIYLAPYAYRKVSWLPKIILKFFLKLPFEYYGKNFLKRGYERIENWYIGNASIFKAEEISNIWKGSMQRLTTQTSLFNEVKNLSDSVKMQYIDINTWLIGDILAKADKMTMAHSLELRVPFLDIEVANLAKTLPDKFKWKKGITKYLLREAFKGIIPESTRNRKKLGFPTPVRDWFTKDRNEIFEKIIGNDYIKKNFNLSEIEQLIKEHVEKRKDNSRKIYTLLMLALWYNIFIAKK